MAVEGAGLTVTCELVPPRGADAASVRAGARQWGEIADAVNVTDGPRASVRMSAVTAAAIMRAEGVETIVQMTTRDRNRIALTADALGSAALGVRGFLALHGDPVSVGENPEAAEVRDLQTLELIALLAGIREGRLLDARADLVQTQIVLDPDAFIDWFGRCREAGVHRRATVLAGIAVPRSAEALAAFERMGARASEDVAERVERGESAEAVVDVIDRLAPVEGLAGVHIMPLGAPPELVRDLAAHARRSWAARAA